MTVRFYSSEDAGAPTLTGQAGSLTNLLDKVLVDGYGSKAAAGWAIAYTATDKRAYRAAAGVRAYLRVNDDAANGAQYADVRGYGAMTDVDTGTEPFPTTAQESIWVALKSTAASATARAWRVFADDRFFYLFANVSGSNWLLALKFGDFVSFKPSDTFNAVIGGAKNSRSTVFTTGNNYFGSLSGLTPQMYLLRASDESVGAVPAVGLGIDMSTNSQGTSGTARHMGNQTAISGSLGPEAYPSPVTGQASITPLMLLERPNSAACGVRGTLPGFFQPLHNVILAFDTQLDGGTQLSGRTLQTVRWAANSNSAATDAYAYIDITGGWR